MRYNQHQNWPLIGECWRISDGFPESRSAVWHLRCSSAYARTVSFLHTAMSLPGGLWRRLQFTMKRSWWSWNPGFRWRWKRKQNMDMRGYPEPISGTGGTHPGEEWHEGNSHELHQQAGRFDGKADRIPGRTVGRFGGSHPHWWERQHGSLPGWDWDYYLMRLQFNMKKHDSKGASGSFAGCPTFCGFITKWWICQVEYDTIFEAKIRRKCERGVSQS